MKLIVTYTVKQWYYHEQAYVYESRSKILECTKDQLSDQWIRERLPILVESVNKIEVVQ